MKRIYLALLPLCLAACDKPDLEIMLQPCCQLGEKLGIMKLKVWDDSRAILNVHGTDIVLTEKDENSGVSTEYWIEWTGKLPDSDEEISVSADYDVVRQAFTYFSTSMGAGSYGTDVVVPMHLTNYAAPSETELCIQKIDRTVYVLGNTVFVVRSEERFDYRGQKNSVEGDTRYEKIPAEDAIAISVNWDYNNLKSYSNRDNNGVEEHEQDACEVLERLNAYIEKQGWDKPRVVYKNEIGCAVPSRVVHLGCDTFENAMFGYLTLNICDNGQHALNVDGRWPRTVPMSVSDKLGGVLYSGTSNGRDQFEVLYNPTEDMWFARNADSSGAYVGCVEKKLEPHQVCAHKIASVTRVEDDGRVALDIKRAQKPSENGQLIEREFIPLTQEQALAVSQNWDYKNLKLYSTGDAPYEADACDAFERLESIKRDLWQQKND